MFIRRWIPVVVWCLVIFGFSSLPSIKNPQPAWWDFWFFKGAHVVEYAILYGLVYRAKSSYAASLLFVILYGISDEYHQSFVAGRESNYMRDVGFDTIGGLLSGVGIWKWSPKVLLRLKSSVSRSVGKFIQV